MQVVAQCRDGSQELTPPEVSIVIEIPRGSFLKRGSSGRIDFISPLPCPYNYGSIPDYIGGEGDLLDAVVLGPRLAVGTVVRLPAWGAIGLSERFMYDDKLICARRAPSDRQSARVLRFFRVYAFCKGILNRLRGQRGAAHCHGWGDAGEAISRAVPVARMPATPRIHF
jgi:inorganic pyrophosphatase